MRFSSTIVVAAFLGFSVATEHMGMTTAAAEAASSTETASKKEGKNKGNKGEMASTATALAAAVSESVAATAAGMVASSTVTVLAAQSAAATGAATGAQVNTHVVQVGSGGALTFSPNNVIAAVGDLVQFQFYPKNHSVVQSTFDQPCVPIQNVMANKTDAFFSGFMPTATNATKMLTYTIRVMDTKPVWFYCSQAKHCQGGMVGAINAVTTGNKTVEAFAGLAKGAVENLSPGQAAGAGAAASQAPGVAASSGAGAGGAAATGTAGSVATTSSASNPAQQTTNAAPRLSGQSLLSLGLGGLAALFVL